MPKPKPKALVIEGQDYSASELAEGVEAGLENSRQAHVEVAAEYVKRDLNRLLKSFRNNTSNRANQVRNTTRITRERVNPERFRPSGSPPMNNPMKDAEVVEENRPDGSILLTVNNPVFNILDQGRDAISTEKPMVFPAYTGNLTNTDVVNLNSGAVRINRVRNNSVEYDTVFVRTRYVGPVAPRNFTQNILKGWQNSNPNQYADRISRRANTQRKRRSPRLPQVDFLFDPKAVKISRTGG